MKATAADHSASAATNKSFPAGKAESLPSGTHGEHINMALLLVGGIVLVSGYFISLRRHPLATCTMCSGTGREYGHIYSYTQRQCRKCSGTGRYDRLGTRMFHGGTANTGRFVRRW
jgi:hypothetical protein